MPPDGSEADHFLWLARAKGALVLAKQGIPDGAFAEDLCYQAQQAAEKALKALFVAHGLTFRYTHDIRELITALQHQRIKVPRHLLATVVLTRYAIETRYPFECDAVTLAEYEEAVDHAESVVVWVESEIERIKS